MNNTKLFRALLLLPLVLTACNSKKQDGGKDAPSDDLKIAIIRHGEKPKDGDNLSCQGQNRALQLPAVLTQKIGTPDYVYVPALENDKSTAHSRMFQTASPLAIKYNLAINSKYSAKDGAEIAKSMFKKKGTVLMVWEHSAIPDLANVLGVISPPPWEEADFDSIWMISYKAGKAELALDNEGIKPSPVCNF